MTDLKDFPIPESIKERALINADQYRKMYQRSVSDPTGFWAEQAQELITWRAPWSSVLDWDFKHGHVRWFEGGKLNISENCVDRHLGTRGDKIAIIWEGNEPGDCIKITYRELHNELCRATTVLRSLGITKGDRVAIYLPVRWL
jgi:acetyl-CoA synthetase